MAGAGSRTGTSSVRTTARTVGGHGLRQASRLVRRVSPRAWQAVVSRLRPEAVRLEVIFDGATLLNWRTAQNVSSIVLTPPHSRAGARRYTRSGGEGPAHGLVPLDELPGAEYLVAASTRYGRVPVELLDESAVLATRNEGWTEGARWIVCDEEGSGVRLVRDVEVASQPRVLDLDSGLGVVVITIGSQVEERWRLELRRRGADEALDCGFPIEIEGTRSTFRLSSCQWTLADLRPDQSISRWNIYAVPEGGSSAGTRLKWGGSSVEDVRASLRFRASTAWATSGEVNRVRPYWTKDQHLAVELARVEDSEGSIA